GVLREANERVVGLATGHPREPVLNGLDVARSEVMPGWPGPTRCCRAACCWCSSARWTRSCLLQSTALRRVSGHPPAPGGEVESTVGRRAGGGDDQSLSRPISRRANAGASGLGCGGDDHLSRSDNAVSL